jgi:DNA primase
MRDAEAVIAGVKRALKPGGRFVAEMGGHGNIASVIVALTAVLARRGIAAAPLNPFYFPTAEAHRGKLEQAGFMVDQIAILPRPTVLMTDIEPWLDAFCETFLRAVPETDRATARRFGIGYAPDSWESLAPILAARGFSPAEMQGGGLTIRRKDGNGHYDRFRHRVIFPIRDAQGRVVAFGGRALGDAEPKYLNSPETPTYVKGEHLYGLDVAKDAIRREGFAVLVEGYLDLIVLHQAGFENAVASLGTALTPAQVRLVSRFAERIVVSYDGDTAGRNAASKSIDLLLERSFEVRVAEIPGGRDPDELIREDGAAAYEALLRGASGFIEFLLRKEIAGRDLSHPGEKVAVINAVLPRLAHLPNAVERSAWAARLAEALALDDDLVLHELRTALKAAKPSIRQRAGADDPLRDVEARLVAVLLASVEAREHARRILGEHELEGSRVSGIVRAILGSEEPGGTLTAATFVDALTEEDDRVLLTRIAFRDEPPGGPEAVDGCLEMLNHARWRRESHDVARTVTSHDRDEQTERLRRLMDLGRRMDAPHRSPTARRCRS